MRLKVSKQWCKHAAEAEGDNEVGAGCLKVTTPEGVRAWMLLALKGALKMEVLGMKASRGRSAYRVVKAQFGFKGSKASVLEQFEAHLRKEGILV